MGSEISNNPKSVAELFLGYIDDPVAFVEDILHAKPDPWQKRALRVISNHRKLAIKSAHGVGKSTFVAWTILWYDATHPFCKIPTTAPNFERQVRAVLWAEVHKWYRQAPILQEHFQLDSVRLYKRDHKEEWFAVGFSVENEAEEGEAKTMEGFHADHIMAAMDEAKGIADSVFESIKGALTGPSTRWVMASTPPLNRAGEFVRIFLKTKKEDTCDGNCGLPDCNKWVMITVKASESPRHTPEWIEDRKKEWGEDSALYKAKVLGEIPDVDEDLFLPIQIMEEQMASNIKKKFDPTEPGIMGVDCSRYGSDYSVIAMRRGPVLMPLLRSSIKLNTMELAGLVISRIEAEWPTFVFIDAIGIGAGVFDRVKEITDNNPKFAGVHVQAVDVGQAAKDAEHYKNQRVELYGNFKTRLVERTIQLPDDDGLIEEAQELKYKYDSAGRLILESKEDMKKRGVPSPDRLDAVSLTFARPRIPWQPALNGGSLDIFGR